MSQVRKSTHKHDMEAPQHSDDMDLARKVAKLETILKTFLAEVDMKMSIVQQILSTRNDQYAVQKKLLEEEHCLYKTVMRHWKDTPELAANGLGLPFSTTDVDFQIEGNVTSLDQTSTSVPQVSRRRQRRRMARKLIRVDGGEGASGFGVDEAMDSHSDASENNDIFDEPGGLGGDENDDQEEQNTVEDDGLEGMEQKVFVDYSVQPTEGGRNHSPIWTHFLREENGKSALCKLCEENGVQKILKMYMGGTFNLHRHLKLTHKLSVIHGPTNKEAEPSEEDVGTIDPIFRSKEVETPCKKPQQGALVWNYYMKCSRDGETQTAGCNLCYDQGKTTNLVVHNGSTWTLHRHLRRVHNVDTKVSSVIPPPPPFQKCLTRNKDEEFI